LPDQYPGEKGSVVSPFFGQNAQTMTLLVKLARKNKARKQQGVLFFILQFLIHKGRWSV
jgi:lauroyl/myristoyl acyltransferase